MKKIKINNLGKDDIGNCYHLSKKCLFTKFPIKEGQYTLLNKNDASGDLNLTFLNKDTNEVIYITASNARKIQIRQMPE